LNGKVFKQASASVGGTKVFPLIAAQGSLAALGAAPTPERYPKSGVRRSALVDEEKTIAALRNGSERARTSTRYAQALDKAVL
jgi:hypothetical protein